VSTPYRASPYRIARVAWLGWLFCGCSLFRSAAPNREIQFEPMRITGDVELARLNDEELFASGSAAFAANDYVQATRYFDRLADFFPNSPHRPDALYNSGLSYERQHQWEDAYARFAQLADPERGTGDSLDAAFRLAETAYHLERYPDAVRILTTISERADLAPDKRMEAQVQKGICELESGQPEAAEATLRGAANRFQSLEDKAQVDDYFPAQAEFFLGEIYRVRYESVILDSDKSADQLARDLEYKAELLLSAQGHYLRSIRVGNSYWCTASGTQIGTLYENLYEHMIHAPAPKELDSEEVDAYRLELRKRIRVLVTKAINIYERTLEAAQRIGSSNFFVQRARDSLRKMKEILVADAENEETDGEDTAGR
jgi:tetratricopeptide (TPR) repeat protein